ncbi:phosphopentomutase [Serpentinicella sp. ANB-PHB4]|uniref:phosphopentomutase n=1 Tax=Serpentinicella sp. ANB-PHB4 TaxID=3074076 RepID=UPI0028653157|nr:phosphopentomutase [Serpentinicella sp. ANB-PHB4]MDR5658169.1 phosphopentomutase [Serpentinicella sp. ANB-PHB4]
MINRVILFVMDSVGIGALPDALEFGDEGANTLGNIIKKENGINLKNLRELGIGNIDDFEFIKSVSNPIGCYGKAKELSNGKDTTTGHWELVGLPLEKPFRTFPNGFPKEIIDTFEKAIGRKVIGNIPASGTKIIEDLGQEHIMNGSPIIYTSADSVFQIAAHEDIISLEELYDMCRKARDIMLGDYAVARIIARPFIGAPGAFKRTPNRKDFSLDPFKDTILDKTVEAGLDVIGIGKINDIFNGKGITKYVPTKNNTEGITRTVEFIKADNKGIIFTNLVDFDSEYGHRRDVKGYRHALEQMDLRIPEILSALKDDDVIIFTADHGNDPTFKGTDHTREYIPVLIYGKKIKNNVNIGTRETFSDIGATISDLLGVSKLPHGNSFMTEIIEKD